LLRQKISNAERTIVSEKRFIKNLRFTNKLKASARTPKQEELFKKIISKRIKRRTGAERRKGKISGKQRARQEKIDKIKARFVLASRQAGKIRDTITFNALNPKGKKTVINIVEELRKSRRIIVDKLAALVNTQNNLEARILSLGKRLDKTTNLAKRKMFSDRIAALERRLDKIINFEFKELNVRLDKITLGTKPLEAEAF